MCTAPRELSPINIYHTSSRGVGQLLIYEDDGDRQAFISFLQKQADALNVSILAWCLMNNHFHIVFQADITHISKLLGIVKSRYVRYFNERHGRSGHLFESRFWSKPVISEEQLLEVVRYVHLNPQEARIADASEYQWSSYHSYTTGTKGLANPAFVLSLFGSIDAFKQFHSIEGKYSHEIAVEHWTRMSDGNAIRTACEELHIDSIGELLRWPLIKRNRGLRTLKERGIPCRQLQRLTGLGRYTIREA